MVLDWYTTAPSDCGEVRGDMRALQTGIIDLSSAGNCANIPNGDSSGFLFDYSGRLSYSIA